MSVLFSGAKLVQGESSAKENNAVFSFALPSRRLTYGKLVQGERRTKSKAESFAFLLPSRSVKQLGT